MGINIYRYSITLDYMKDKKLYTLNNNNIHSMTIDYDYDNKNMPIIIMQVAVDKDLLDHMIKNSTTNTITLTIKKYIKDANPKIEENYIKDEFIYFLPNDLNYNKDLDYHSSNAEREDIYRIINIGLMPQKIINNNKKVINGILNGVSMTSILVSYLSDRKLLLEPPLRKSVSLIVPPLSTVTSFIKHINNNYNIYSTSYRLFYDFDKTYMLSTNSTNIQAKSDLMNTVIININNTIKPESKVQGMEINYKNKAYILEIDPLDISIGEDKATQRSYDSIIGVGSNGNYSKVNLNVSKNNATNGNTRIERFTNSSTEKVSNIKSDIETRNTIVNVVKNELDTSVFTMNKEYIINNYEQLRDKNGKFILSRKREIYVRDDHNYVLTNILTLRRIS